MTRGDASQIVQDETFRLIGLSMYKMKVCTEPNCSMCEDEKVILDNLLESARKVQAIKESCVEETPDGDEVSQYLNISDEIFCLAINKIGDELGLHAV